MASGPDAQIEFTGGDGGTMGLGTITTTATIGVDDSGIFLLAASGGSTTSVPAPNFNGVVIVFASARAQTNVVSFTGATLRNGANATATTATLANVVGAGITVVGYNGLWYLMGSIGSVSYG